MQAQVQIGTAIATLAIDDYEGTDPYAHMEALYEMGNKVIYMATEAYTQAITASVAVTAVSEAVNPLQALGDAMAQLAAQSDMSAEDWVNSLSDLADTDADTED